MKILTTTTELNSSKISKDCTITFLADIHKTKYSKMKLWNNIISMTKEQQPNYIVMAGDFIYNADDLFDYSTEYRLEYLLSKLANIAPVLAVSGNHDQKKGLNYTTLDVDNYFKNIERDNNFTLLDNKILETNDFSFIGVKPYIGSYYTKDKSKRYCSFIEGVSSIKNLDNGIRSEKFNILITHSPQVFSALEQNLVNEIKSMNPSSLSGETLSTIKRKLELVDLFLAGHMHDGLIPKHWQKLGIITGTKGISVSENTIFGKPKIMLSDYCRGTSDMFNGKLIVTGGISKWARPNPAFGLIDKVYASDIDTVKILKKG